MLPVSGLSTVLGFMMVASWLTKENRNSIYPLMGREQQIRYTEGQIDLLQYQNLQKEVDTLLKRATALEKALSEKNTGSGALNESLQNAKIFAGLTELEGPGVKIVLRDNPRSSLLTSIDDLIHDTDVLHVTNELFNAGAEAISVNGERLIASSNIRCAGTVISVDGVRIASPFVILAIGKVDVLYNGFTMQGGVMTELVGANPAMIQITKEKLLRVPAYLGATTTKVGTVPKVTTK